MRYFGWNIFIPTAVEFADILSVIIWPEGQRNRIEVGGILQEVMATVIKVGRVVKKFIPNASYPPFLKIDSLVSFGALFIAVASIYAARMLLCHYPAWPKMLETITGITEADVSTVASTIHERYEAERREDDDREVILELEISPPKAKKIRTLVVR